MASIIDATSSPLLYSSYDEQIRASIRTQHPKTMIPHSLPKLKLFPAILDVAVFDSTMFVDPTESLTAIQALSWWRLNTSSYQVGLSRPGIMHNASRDGLHQSCLDGWKHMERKDLRAVPWKPTPEVLSVEDCLRTRWAGRKGGVSGLENHPVCFRAFS